MNEIVERIPNTQPISFRPVTDPVKKQSGKSAKEYRIERDDLQERLDTAKTKIDELEKQLNAKYQSGYQAGITKGKESTKHPALDLNQEGWYKRAMSAEYEAKKLKTLLGDVTKLIIEGAL